MIVHINSNIIKANKKNGKHDPPISIRRTRSGEVIARFFELEIEGKCKIVYDPHKPLKCGAKVWIETEEMPCGRL